MEKANDHIGVEDHIDEDIEQGVETTKVERRLSFVDLYKIRPPKHTKDYPLKETILLAYQSLGVVYGDLGTSPLYTFPSVRLSNPAEEDILGILSIILWSLTLVCVVKYVCIVLRADDHGEGGTFAIYSLLSRHLNFHNNKISRVSRLDSDANLRYYSNSVKQTKAKRFFEESKKAQSVLTFIVMLGICMVIGDGALTPAISVLSAVQGIQSRAPKIHQGVFFLVEGAYMTSLLSKIPQGAWVPFVISFFVLSIVYSWIYGRQKKGEYEEERKMGLDELTKLVSQENNQVTRVPGICFFCTDLVNGVPPIIRHYVQLLGSLRAEAMFADLGHFNKRSIQIAFIGYVYPALVLTYSGEAAYLIKYPENMSTAFYSAVPNPVFWPIFVLATLAAVVGSQCLISASFSIIKQAMTLGCFPRVTMIQTSDKYEGQVYSPEINYFVMVICILIVVFFKGGEEIGNAYGAAVILVMMITTCLMVVVMLVVWDTHFLLILLFLGVFFIMEGAYMTALLTKIPQGAWVPFVISFSILLIIYSWMYGQRRKREYEAVSMMSLDELTDLVRNNDEVTRVPGICFFCTDLETGIPPIVRHYVQLSGSLHHVMVIITVRTLPIESVHPSERFLVARLGTEGIYRCLVQYGRVGFCTSSSGVARDREGRRNNNNQVRHEHRQGNVRDWKNYILKNKCTSGWLHRLVIDHFYKFLKNNSRTTISSLKIRPNKMLEVGMIYEV
ncbi:hypothetical protein H6P81_018559 [Aristolochia fimbriata]|uniref:Potassium transporter n=1 Tax=Aristolochia fimbriata TaxID=158543 RepID=A0AAV7E3K4_ARIFI|nr:hypothetical protein H6P81_018559 [Aristolochia fimbriata]